MEEIENNDVIVGFSYKFSLKIFKKLEQLHNEDRIFEEGNEEVQKPGRKQENHQILPLARSFVFHLETQVHIQFGCPDYESFQRFMKDTKEFLETVKPDDK